MNGKCTACLTTLIAACLALLPGCSTVRGELKMDRAPANLRQPCPPLEAIKPGALLGDLIEQMVVDAGTYQECARIVDGWIRWEEGVNK